MCYQILFPKQETRMVGLSLLLLLSFIVCIPFKALAEDDQSQKIGINLAGAEFHHGGPYGKSHIYPELNEFRYYKKKGFTVFRIPFSWERMQPRLNESFDAEEVAHLDEVVAAARMTGVKIILDVHSYDRRNGRVIGSDPALETAFSDLWRRLADRYKKENAVWAFGLMNEPHDTGGTWAHTAQLAVDAIRSVDTRHTILLAGDSWSSAEKWVESNPHILDVKDPSEKIVYEAHIYFDRDSSGIYKHTYDEDGVYPDIGVKRVDPFLEWISVHHVKGFLGEFGVPGNDPRWNVVLDRFLNAIQEKKVGGTYWAGGSIWHNYLLSCEPTSTGDAPQMQILSHHVKRRQPHWYFPLGF